MVKVAIAVLLAVAPAASFTLGPKVAAARPSLQSSTPHLDAPLSTTSAAAAGLALVPTAASADRNKTAA